MQVGQMMKQPIYACQPSETLNRAAQIMWDQDCGCVPVVGDDGTVVGMITDRDICMAAYTRGASLGALEVHDTMSKDLYACHPDDALADVERMMRVNQVRRMPVTDTGGKLVGMVSLNDLAREAGRETGTKKRAVTFADVGKTLEAVCRPRGSRAIAAAA